MTEGVSVGIGHEIPIHTTRLEQFLAKVEAKKPLALALSVAESNELEAMQHVLKKAEEERAAGNNTFAQKLIAPAKQFVDRIPETTKRVDDLVTGYIEIAKAYTNSGMATLAHRNLRKAQNIMNEYLREFPTLQTRWRILLGQVYEQSGSPEKAKSAYKQAFKFAEKLQYGSDVTDSAELFVESGNYIVSEKRNGRFAVERGIGIC